MASIKTYTSISLAVWLAPCRMLELIQTRKSGRLVPDISELIGQINNSVGSKSLCQCVTLKIHPETCHRES